MDDRKWTGFGGGLDLDVGFQSSENAIDGDASSLKWTAARSAGFKHDGSGFWSDDWRSSKLAKTDYDYSPSSAAASDVHMLSFSSSSSKSDTSTSPYFQPLAGAHPKSAGYYSGALNTSTCMYLLNGVRGPFTSSQWLELEQQALIYKYLTASEPIPAQLLIPIKKALESAGLFGFNGGPMRPTAWGWGPFQLGYSNSNDPEPGRCRRTDGKKWRCSRDAVPDQKYCERHINRGRHRSRKLVEGQVKGHSVSGATISTTTTKLTLPSAVAASSAPVAPGVGLSNSFDMNQHYQQAKSLQHSASNPAMNPLMDRMLANRENGSQGLQDATQLSFLSLCGSNVNLNYTDRAFSIPKHCNTNEESAPNSFAVPSSGTPLFTITTGQKNNPFCSRNGASSHGLNGTGGSSILWPGLQLPSDATQLSASIPMGSSDFITSLSSQTSDNASFLPFRHPQQLEMGLGVGAQSHNNGQANWMSSSWEPSMGGPLGEALQSSGGVQGEGKKTAALNLLPKGWDGMGSYQLSSSSPTGVLQKSALVSLSNSSAGSSPRTDNNKTIESSGSLCNDLLGSTTLAHSSSLPALE